jgi:hypothetical protein
MEPREDDASIPDDEILWRRVGPDDLMPEEEGHRPVKSLVFKSRGSDGISVHLSSQTSLEAVLAAYESIKQANPRRQS